MLTFSFSTSKPFYKMQKFGSNQILSFVDKKTKDHGFSTKHNITFNDHFIKAITKDKKNPVLHSRETFKHSLINHLTSLYVIPLYQCEFNMRKLEKNLDL